MTLMRVPDHLKDSIADLQRRCPDVPMEDLLTNPVLRQPIQQDQQLVSEDYLDVAGGDHIMEQWKESDRPAELQPPERFTHGFK